MNFQFYGFTPKHFGGPVTDSQKSFAAWAAIASTFVLMLWFLAPVMAPFIVAAVLAYALTPLVDRLDAAAHGRVPRVLAVLVVELLFVLLALGLVLLIVPILVKELPLMRDQLPLLLDKANTALQPLLLKLGVKLSLDLPSIKAFVATYLSANFDDALGSVLASVKIGGSAVFAVVGNAVLIPVALFYLLMDWERLVRTLRDLVPPRLRLASDSFLQEADQVLGEYLRGQLMVMGVLAVYYSVGLALFGLDLALPIGTFTGLAVFVPYLGFGLGLVLALLAGLLEFAASGGAVQAVVMVAVVYGLGQLVESFFLTPRLVGERIGLHPLAVIFALLAFGQLFGFVGILVALPVSAVLLVAVRRVRAGYLASGLYQGQGPHGG
jgi:predicted PurR-regulated permease PerM